MSGRAVTRKMWLALAAAGLVYFCVCALVAVRGARQTSGDAYVKESTATAPTAPSAGQTGTENRTEQDDGIHEAPAGYAPDGTRRMIALTFDDGPFSPVTEAILDALEACDGRATFFCLGNRAETYEKTLRRAVDLGCEIASHSYAHKRLPTLGAAALEKDFAKANAALEQYSQKAPSLLRPPFGDYDKRVLSSADMPVILWSIDTVDWQYAETPDDRRGVSGKRRDLAKIVNGVYDQLQDGDIVLMHDIFHMSKEAAVRVIQDLSDKGWQLVTVTELFAIKGIELEDGKVYYCAR
ncbi:MAG: polysaccharide deacetylase family protein [Oscillospiraceae bacterium]|nr:polysaccharide deacetylase family protein [Oscillospiraceae bacterium]